MFISSGSVKQRQLPGPVLTFKEHTQTTLGDPEKLWVSTVGVGGIQMEGTQITESDRNRWPPPKGGPIADYGSEFYTQKKEVLPSKLAYSVLYTGPTGGIYGTHKKLEGNIMANCFQVSDNASYWGVPHLPLTFAWPPDMSSSRHDLELMGTRAIGGCAPGNSIANAASFIGELVQDLPRIPGIALWESRLKALMTLAAAGEEFLNLEFAVNPTIGDMQQFLRAVHNIDKQVDHFVKDSGKLVRRSFTFPKEVSKTTTTLGHTYSPAGHVMYAGGMLGHNSWIWPRSGTGLACRETIRERVIERETWFDGAFTYHLPSGYDTHSKSDRRKLMAQFFGAKPDLNTLWQLAPWSWAVDWFSDASSFVKNLQNYLNYGTVMQYGYVMEKTTVTDTFTAGGVLSNASGYFSNQPPPAVSAVSLRVTTKKRIQANPFGFGFSWDGLSTVQQAILAALGITRIVK